MKQPFLSLLAGAAAWTGALLLTGPAADAESWKLETKRLDARSDFSPVDYLYRATNSQYFYMQFQEKAPEGREQVRIAGQPDQEQAFKRIVKKEPAEYACKHPFRGVAKLGSHEYAFVLDAAPPKPEPKEKASKPGAGDAKSKEEAKPAAKAGLLEVLGRAMMGESEARPPVRRGRAIVYSRLYFDVNRNGDLTDDKVIEAEPGSVARSASADYANCRFPRVDLTVDADGAKVDYAFTLSVQSNAMSDDASYIYASLNAAAYREGEITLEGKKHRVAVIDFNSNGRFDDEIKLPEATRGPRDELSPVVGDVLMLDPEAQSPVYYNPYDVTSSGNRYYVSKLMNIDGRYYDVKVSPAGDQLTLTPATASLGHATSPHGSFNAVLYSDKGFVKISGAKSAPVALPEGDWKLLSYTIDRTGEPEPKPKPEEKKPAEKPKSSGLLPALVKAFSATARSTGVESVRPFAPTQVSASGTGECKPIQVRKGQTVVLPFGPPYKPVVSVDYAQGGGMVRLGLTLVGASGERCTDMMIRGGRPSNPQFTIRNPKGDVVQRGQFEYG